MAKAKKLKRPRRANTAAAIACIVETLNELDQSFKGRFLKRLTAVSGADAAARFDRPTTARKRKEPVAS